MLPEFKSFGKIEYIDTLKIAITQKIHGSNGQIMVYYKEDGTLDCIAGNRYRWLTVDNDNHGFCAFVEKNKEALIKFLGKGRHFGEWAGPGLFHGEGLKEKTFVLFRWEHFIDRPKESFPPQITYVPVIYSNTYTEVNRLAYKCIQDKYIKAAMDHLKEHGSFLVEGFMEVEGIVVDINGMKFKAVFNQQETGWKKKKIHKVRLWLDVSHLLQELRLEKLLFRDECYLREYPSSLKDICSDYVKDVEEELFPEVPEDDVKAIKKALGRKIFVFVKDYVEKKHEVSA